MAFLNICLVLMSFAGAFLSAKAENCDGYIFSRIINEDVETSSGRCELYNTIVNGDIKSGESSSYLSVLYSRVNSRIEKNLGEVLLENIVAKEVVIKDNTNKVFIKNSSIVNLDCQSNSFNPDCIQNVVSDPIAQCSAC